jgi:hypothetical protein
VTCLVIRKRSNAHMGDLFRACDTGCREQGTANASYRVGIYYLELLGRPYAYLCTECCKQFEALWVSAGGQEPVRIRQRFLKPKAEDTDGLEVAA